MLNGDESVLAQEKNQSPKKKKKNKHRHTEEEETNESENIELCPEIDISLNGEDSSSAKGICFECFLVMLSLN